MGRSARRPPQTRARVAALLLAPALLAGCASGQGTPDPTGFIPTPWSESPSASASASSSPTGSTPPAVRVANDALAASLAQLSGSILTLQKDDGVRSIRSVVAKSTSTGRGALSALRRAAFPEATRSCTTVRAQLGTISRAGSEARSAAGGVAAALARIAAEEAAVTARATTVSKDLASLQAALKGVTGATTVNIADVKAALTAASGAVTESRTEIARYRADIADGVARLADFAATGSSTAAKAGC